MKKQTLFICQNCGYSLPRWMGKCPECDSWNTIIEEPVAKGEKKQKRSGTGVVNPPLSIDAIPDDKDKRLASGIDEFDRVLGGGIVLGSVILIGGAPGIGKSTLLLQTGARIAKRRKTVLYISGEESVRQIKIRADRLSIGSDSFFILTETDVDTVALLIKEQKPDLVVIDSIQTIYSSDLESMPGNVSQVRYSGHVLTQTAKQLQVPIFMVGHVNKAGSIAGPRVLEHLVDGLLMFEGDEQHLYRLLRAVKNRFGSTNEVGIFEMTDRGVLEINNPSEYLLSQRKEKMPGTMVTVSREGTRSLLVEVQALVSPTSYGVPQRTATGIDYKRLSILLAVLERRMGLRFGSQDVFVNAAGGIKLTEPAVDLAVAAAIVSSLKDNAGESKTAVIGEIGLTGEVRGVSGIENRISEAERLGFQKIVVPKINLNGLKTNFKIKVIGVDTVGEAIQNLNLN